MKRIVWAAAAVVVIVVMAALSWYFRPWAEYAPAKIARLNAPENYPQTFRAMDEIFPHREIAASAGAAPLPRNEQSLDLTYEWNGGEKSLDQFLEEARTLGLIVLKDGAVIHEEYRMEAGPDDRFTSWSVGKSFVATLVAMAMRDGLIDSLDDPAEKYAAQFEGSDYGGTSLRHLLMMSAGVDFNEDYGAPDSDIDPFFFDAFIMGKNVDEMAAAIERDRPAGEDLHYVSPNTHVLSAVVRAVYDKPLAAIMEEQIWKPLDMSGDAYWSQNVQGGNGIAIGYCCLNAKLEDYARFGQFYLQDGVWNGQRLLPEGWVTMATTPQAPFQEPGATYDIVGYGLHFWVPEDADGEFQMAGVFGQYIWVDRKRGVVIARNSADPEFGSRLGEAITVMRAISAAVSPEPETESAEAEAP